MSCEFGPLLQTVGHELVHAMVRVPAEDLAPERFVQLRRLEEAVAGTLGEVALVLEYLERKEGVAPELADELQDAWYKDYLGKHVEVNGVLLKGWERLPEWPYTVDLELAPTLAEVVDCPDPLSVKLRRATRVLRRYADLEVDDLVRVEDPVATPRDS